MLHFDEHSLPYSSFIYPHCLMMQIEISYASCSFFFVTRVPHTGLALAAGRNQQDNSESEQLQKPRVLVQLIEDKLEVNVLHCDKQAHKYK